MAILLTQAADGAALSWGPARRLAGIVRAALEAAAGAALICAFTALPTASSWGQWAGRATPCGGSPAPCRSSCRRRRSLSATVCCLVIASCWHSLAAQVATIRHLWRMTASPVQLCGQQLGNADPGRPYSCSRCCILGIIGLRMS